MFLFHWHEMDAKTNTQTNLPAFNLSLSATITDSRWLVKLRRQEERNGGENSREEFQAYGWLLSAPLPLPSFPLAVRSAAAGQRWFSF